MYRTDINISLDKLKTIFGFTAGLATISYISGFIIVNAYMSSYGIFHFSLLDSQFLIGGLCFLVFFGMFIIFYMAIPLKSTPSETWDRMNKILEERINEKIQGLNIKSKQYRQAYEKSFRFSYRLSYYIGFVVSLLISQLKYFALFLLTIIPVLFVSGSDVQIVFSWQIWAWTIISAVIILLSIDALCQNGPPRSVPVFFAGFFLIFSLVIFGKNVYPHISPSVGGGKPPIIRLIIPDDHKKFITNAIDLEINDGLSDSVELLAQSSNSIFLILRKEKKIKVASISSDMISGIRYNEK